MKARSSAQIIKKIGCKHLSLYRDQGYWYFVYDTFEAADADRTVPRIFECKSVMVPRLNDMELDSWVEEGKAFVKHVEQEV